ncbi:MAG: response regulator [Fibrobacter sp.]|nr:response regulator [Fibrobacter sp.]
MKKILIVDDSKEIRHLVKTTLEMNDYKVIEAPDGNKAVEIARKIRPDIIIMDLMMPGMDGFEATRLLTTDPETKDSKIIILTGSELRNKERAMAVGADDFFVKPFSPLDLIAKVESIIGSAL